MVRNSAAQVEVVARVTDQIRQALDAFEVALADAGARNVANLAPGLSRDAIRKAFNELALEPSAGVLELYSWHDGIRLDRSGRYEEWEIGSSIYFPPLDYAVETYRRLGELIDDITQRLGLIVTTTGVPRGFQS